MPSVNEFISSYVASLERRKAALRVGVSLTSDAPPPETRLMSTLRASPWVDPDEGDVERAILGASVGG